MILELRCFRLVHVGINGDMGATHLEYSDFAHRAVLGAGRFQCHSEHETRNIC